MYRQSKLGRLLQELYYWNNDCYHMAYPSQSVDDTGWLVNKYHKTEQLAIRAIEEREECVQEIVYATQMLNIDIIAAMSDKKYLDLLMDTTHVTPDEIEKMISQIREGFCVLGITDY
ncbi:hypothetical protein [Alkalibacillus silvisoli]|uniref:Uncharacterized protein n=1 Tax=Alkalibacillus silvisoli TaxID=392823 RepID=A0ABN1AC68_9BACI